MDTNDATDFLVSKKILKKDFTKFVHSWDYKEKVDLALLLEEFCEYKSDLEFHRLMKECKKTSHTNTQTNKNI